MNDVLGEKKEDRVHDQLFRLRKQLLANEHIWSGFRRVELELIGAHSLYDLIAILSRDLPLTFASVDFVTVACFDPGYEMLRLVEQGGDADDVITSFVPVSHNALTGLFSAPWRPWLGPCHNSLQQLLFPQTKDPVSSVALAPLILRDQLIGALNQGSTDPGHFARDVATDLLEHLAAVVAMCLDNAVSHERLKLDGLTDPLTRIANRRFFERRMAQEMEAWLRRREPIACMLIDIDHFKGINDRHGHQIGDRVLQEIAELLGRDLRGADMLARYGGEEFVLLMPHTSAKQAIQIAERVRASVEQQKFVDANRKRLSITVSIGVAALDDDSKLSGPEAADALLRRADAALYRAKDRGRNRVL